MLLFGAGAGARTGAGQDWTGSTTLGIRTQVPVNFHLDPDPQLNADPEG